MISSTPPDPLSSTLAAVASRYARPASARWDDVPPELDAAVARDGELAEVARAAREKLVGALARRFEFPPRFLEAIHEVRRERFVLPEDIAASADDTPLPLDEAGHATVSAPHAYLLTYDLLGLGPGDHLLELGTGTGYGAALARRIVGPAGCVTSIEIDPALHERAARLLDAERVAAEPLAERAACAPPGARAAEVRLLCGDGRGLAEQVLARTPPFRARPWKIAVTYALTALPIALERLLPERGLLVAPVGVPEGRQELVRVERQGGALLRAAHGAVRYVSERHGP